jgi:tetratricopeptide (TPR) repeat protein
MSDVSPAVDPKTAQRLRARRIVVVDTAASRAHAFAQALQQSGAAVATISPADKDYRAAHALDADVMLVNEDEPESCRALVLALRQHPRSRWSTVLPISFSALWPSDADQPDVASIADQVNGFATALVELTVRAKGKLPHDAPLEPLGPSRTLRALASTGRSLRVALSDERIRAELELTESGHVGGLLAWIAGAEAPLSGAEALSVVLAIPSGQLHIEEERGEPALPRWNIELTAALERAAVITQERGLHPTVPQLSFADILAEASALGRDRILLPVARPEPPPPPTPASDPAPAEAIASVSVTCETSEPPIVERRSRAAKPSRTSARTLAMAFALLGACTLAFAVQVRSRRHEASGARSERTAAPFTGSLATALAHHQPKHVLAAAPPPAAALPSAEPVLAAPAEAAPAPRELSRSEREQVKRIVKRAHHYLRAKRYATAAVAYEKALALDSSHVIALRALVRIHLHERDVEEALRWAQRLAQLEPDSSVSQRLLGDARALSDDDALPAAERKIKQ